MGEKEVIERGGGQRRINEKTRGENVERRNRGEGVGKEQEAGKIITKAKKQ